MEKRTWIHLLCALLLVALPRCVSRADVPTPVPPDQRGTEDAERRGLHDASNIRTRFWNYGMVGDYPADPANVDLSVFHSAEVPKGTGMNYTDGITPFVLAKITQGNGSTAYIMETGFRERQGNSPFRNRAMRFEPRPGYLQVDPSLNVGRSPAISNDPRTWPDIWPDRLDSTDDPGWPGSWNGYFGKQIVADQESYVVLDDQYYDAWNFYPDSRDSTRRGLGLRIEVRGFQWANRQARNVIFWHYDITNESTTDYDDNILFGVYMDSGVGGSALSCDGIFESDDDNAFYTRKFGDQVINLVYTWDRGGRGVDLNSNCSPTGYLGYAYLETPGNPTDGVDNDEDGITDERRDGGPGQRLVGAAAIEAYVAANYSDRFEATYGPLADRPAYRAEEWWTGDEDMDWVAELHDTGADGVFDTGDRGEMDGMPPAGEPNFDDTDLNESDQIGLTGFKMNRIRPGQGNPDQTVDDIVFFTNDSHWPERLYEQFTDPDENVRFDDALASNYNIGFLFASGPFRLAAGQTERFSLALAYGSNLNSLQRTVKTVQQIYDANYRFAQPPTAPVVQAEAGDGYVRLTWGDISEREADPVTGEFDFEGYRIYRSTDADFLDPPAILNSTGTDVVGRQPAAQFDLVNEYFENSEQVVDGAAFYLGNNTGLTHTWIDTTVTNGQLYYYAVTAYDHGQDETDSSAGFFPSENSYSVTRTERGEIILPSNVILARPNPRAAGYVPASIDGLEQISGRGVGSGGVEVLNSSLVPDDHIFKITFDTGHPDSIRARTYALADSTTGRIFFETGSDLAGEGTGPVGGGLLPVLSTLRRVEVDSTRTGLTGDSETDARLTVFYSSELSPNYYRTAYPDDISVVFADAIVDTSTAFGFSFPARPARFRVYAHTADGDRQLDFLFRDSDGDGTISGPNDLVDIITPTDEPLTIGPPVTWRVRLEAGTAAPTDPPGEGDVFEVHLRRPFSYDDVFVFRSQGEHIDPDQGRAKAEFSPYVVPNPYVGSSSFEPERFAVSGRGDRRIEFRGLPRQCTIRIFTLRGALVQTLHHEGDLTGYEAWDLRTKDNLDAAPGLYIYHVDAGSLGTHIGKFALIK